MIDGLLRLFPKNPPGWLLYPEDWVGVHKLLDSIPLALGLIVLGVFWFVGVGLLAVRLEARRERRRLETEEKTN
jgi:hypothetical protein